MRLKSSDDEHHAATAIREQKVMFKRYRILISLCVVLCVSVSCLIAFFGPGRHVNIAAWIRGIPLPLSVVVSGGFFLIGTGPAFALYLWLSAVRKWRFFFVAWTAVTACLCCILVICVPVLGRDLIRIAGYGDKFDILSGLSYVLVTGSAWAGAWFWFAVCCLFVPFFIATGLSLRSPSRETADLSPPNRFVLRFGIIVLLIITGAFVRNIAHCALVSYDVSSLERLGVDAGVKSGCVTRVTFRNNGRPPLKGRVRVPLDVVVANYPNLESVCLYESNVQDEDIRCLANLKRLTYLDLAKTPVTDRCVATLEQLPNRCILHLSETRISAAGADRLKKMHRVNWHEPRRVPGGQKPPR